MIALRRSFPRTRRCRLQCASPVRFDHRRLSTPSALRRAESTGPLFPDPPTAKHRDLSSFVSYAERAGLDKSSTIYVGTHYEYTVSATLAQYSITAMRVGGISDNGIDLLGTWQLPSRREKLKVILQCKGGSQKISPSLVRELEGSFIGAPVGWRCEGVVAFLVSENTATKGVREAMSRSRWPMGFISCSRDGVVRQMIWNQRAEDEGLRGMNVGVRHSEETKGEAEVVLTYQGRRIRGESDATYR
ncbi:Uncharacterized protein CTRI78_v003679 [Colletotrichum trifolii]|uniref:Uncharacterized protein n=1 Tax=Colletotrichum trifolii TaxID=5466 RepID=A0A4R8RJ12_COLTR|nr:Uncharacterized protein CTRI78_v003679 [Colletotrichum trifolii]